MNNERILKRELERYEIALLVGALIWILSFILNCYLEISVEKCYTNEPLILESLIKNFMPYPDPYGFAFVVTVICMLFEFLAKLLIFYHSDLICTNTGLLLVHYMSIVLKIIIFSPIIVIGVLIFEPIKCYMMNNFTIKTL